jgi:dTDP-4-amino-4,6-dideoxygalactose transaminase
MEWEIPLMDLDYGPEESEAVRRVVERRWLTAGPETAEFETEFGQFIAGGETVMLSSATAALHLGLRMLGVGPGDDVLVPSLTFVATANAALYCGARPVFCDIVSDNDPTIDPEDAARKLTARTKAIIPVHFAGYACDIAGLAAKLAERANAVGIHSPAVLEDNAHGVGSKLRDGQSLGACGAGGAFSFFSNKNLSTGEGGALWLPDAQQAARARILRGQGLTRPTWQRHAESPAEYDVLELGFNYRPTELTAALARAQLAKLTRMNARRRELDALYRELFANVDEVKIAFAGQSRTTDASCHILPAVFSDAQCAERVRALLYQKRIQTTRHYRPVHELEFYRKRLAGAPPLLPRTEAFAEREVTLPLWSSMRDEHVIKVVNAVKEALAAK